MVILWSYCLCTKTSYLLQFVNFFSQYLIKRGKKFLYKDSNWQTLGLNMMVCLPRIPGFFHAISNPLPMIFWSPTHGIIEPLWYIDPPTHGILNPLLMVLWPPLLARMRGFNLPWWGSKYYDWNLTLGSKYHMVFWTWGQFFRGSKYHMTPG